IAPALDLFAARYSRAEIVYVHGNHEYYGTTREAAVEVTRGACARHANLHWLEQQMVELRGTRFVGATLWFPYDERVHPLRGMLNDFHKIEGFEAWNYEANASAARFLEREVRPGDVVVTHHLPVRASVAEQYKDDPFNAFFLSDVEPILHAKRPRLWIHGHTHASVDVVVGDKPETDGALAVALGARYGLVLSGVTSAADLPADPAPWAVGADLADLVGASGAGRP
ncbi:MAG TPA: HAD hydrolase-like protein, partial [Microthrixaceae bacterium]|nr:HAD hydrolase-like protein [Microthrixaceae bacterium]